MDCILEDRGILYCKRSWYLVFLAAPHVDIFTFLEMTRGILIPGACLAANVIVMKAY